MKYLLTVLLFATAFAHADTATVEKRMDSMFGERAAYIQFFHDLQSAVALGDHQSAATLMAYPLTVFTKNGKVEIRGPVEFIKKYDQIMTEAVVTTISNQKFEDLFVNYQGVMLGRGQVWYVGVCKDNQCKNIRVGVVTINQTAPK